MNLEQGETVLPITDYEDLYGVTSHGRVYSHPKLVGFRLTKGKFLKNVKNNHGYLHVSLCKNKEKKTPKVHRLVAQAFLPDFVPYSDGKEVNHIDGVKSNNHVSNLERVAQQSNVNYARHNKLDHVSQVSLYCGVSWQNRPRCWCCSIGIGNKKTKYIGSYFTEVEAAEAWDNYLRENNIKGELFNFPRGEMEEAAIQQ